MESRDTFEIPKSDLNRLIGVLGIHGYRVIGPTVSDDAIVYDEIHGADELPVGWIDEQDAGRYRLRQTGDGRFFDYVVGPHSLKKYFFPPRLALLQVTRTSEGLALEDPEAANPPGKTAFLGVRACELAAVGIQDTVFLKGHFVDRHYALRREDAFFLAVNCVRPGGTCFCVSMETGPRVERGFDLALTELDETFVVEVGSDVGGQMIAELEPSAAPDESVNDAEQRIEAARLKMGRRLETEGLPQLLLDNLEHPRWEDVAERCLSCANCTMVCPTCFCSNVEEVNDLRPETSTRVRVWDSCFTMDFAYMHGGSARPTIRHRYRQWMTHKLATWHGQFGSSGCVGCGRCITWCPPGIDITEEAAAIRATAGAEPPVETTDAPTL